MKRIAELCLGLLLWWLIVGAVVALFIVALVRPHGEAARLLSGGAGGPYD